MSFSKTTVTDCPLGPVTSGLMDFGPFYSTRPRFFTVNPVSNPTLKQLVTSTTFVPLLHLWAHLIRRIGTVACRDGLATTFWHDES